MRRILLAFVVGAALTTVAPSTASASHPCLDWHPLTCALTRPCIDRFCT